MTPREMAMRWAEQGYSVDEIRAALREQLEEAVSDAEQFIAAHERRERIQEQNDEGVDR